MIALTQRLVERDEQIMALQDELDAYDRRHKELEEKLDEKTALLIKCVFKSESARTLYSLSVCLSVSLTPCIHSVLRVSLNIAVLSRSRRLLTGICLALHLVI